MFLIRRPSAREIEEFIKGSINLPLSYEQVGVAKHSLSDFRIDEASATIGRGKPAFEQAKLALSEWRNFQLGWVESIPKNAHIEQGTTVAILIHPIGVSAL